MEKIMISFKNQMLKPDPCVNLLKAALGHFPHSKFLDTTTQATFSHMDKNPNYLSFRAISKYCGSNLIVCPLSSYAINP